MENIEYLAGAGNSFAIGEELNLTSDIEVISYVADASFDIDGVISVTKDAGNESSINMDYFNADGSPAELCLNGVRCSAKFAFDRDLVNTNIISINTPSGTIETEVANDNTVTSSINLSSKIPINEYYINGLRGHYINVGNPHFVIETDDISKVNLESIGSEMQKVKEFPSGVNIEFFNKIDNENISARVYERGVGETQSCGSGAIAMYLVINKLYNIYSNLVIRYPGGKLTVSSNNNLFQLSGEVIYL